MAPYRTALGAYINRPLLRGSMAIVIALAIYTLSKRHDPDRGYVMAGTLLMIGIMGVQVAGYIGVTAIQLIWNDRARVMPGVKRAHFPVLVTIVLSLFGFVVAIGALSRQDPWMIAAVTAQVMVAGLWLVTLGRWWILPVVVYFLSFPTFASYRPGLDGILVAASAVAVVAWLWKVFLLGGEPIDFSTDFLIRADSRWFEVWQRIIEVGPMWTISRIRWRRGSLMWRLSRWWPSAGDSWMILLFVAPTYLAVFGNSDRMNALMSQAFWQGKFPGSAMSILTGVPMLLGMSMIVSRGPMIAMQSVWPVRRRVMLAEHLAIILIEVSAIWLICLLPIIALAAQKMPILDWRGAAICAAGSLPLVAMILGVLAWLEPRPMEPRAPVIVVLGVLLGVAFGRKINEMSNLFAAGCVLLIVLAACMIWWAAVRRWLAADLTRTPNEGKVFNV